MTENEKQDFLKRQLELLEKAADDAEREGFYGNIPDIVRTAVDVLGKIVTMPEKA